MFKLMKKGLLIEFFFLFKSYDIFKKKSKNEFLNNPRFTNMEKVLIVLTIVTMILSQII